MPADTNPSGDIFGGWLMAQMDLAGANAAVRRARGRCVAVAVDGMVFHEPVFVGDEVSLYTIALADFVGVEKPDERIFRYALKTAGVSPSRAVHVGNRLESDIRPAQRLGMRTVWLLRGGAPDGIPFTGHSQRRAPLVIRFAFLDLAI